jgi:hypothetical protein
MRLFRQISDKVKNTSGAPHESGFDFDSQASVQERIGDIEDVQDIDNDGMRLSTLTRATLTGRQRSSTRPTFRSSITEDNVEEINSLFAFSSGDT